MGKSSIFAEARNKLSSFKNIHKSAFAKVKPIIIISTVMYMWEVPETEFEFFLSGDN